MNRNKKRTKKRISFISKMIYLILIVISVFLFGIVLSMNIVPMKYIIPVIIVYGIICLGIGSLIFAKKARSWLKIFMDFISIIIIVLIGAILSYLNTTLHFMDEIKVGKYQTEQYYVLVDKDSSYSKITDLASKSMAIYESTIENYTKALEEVKSKVKLEEKTYNSYTDASQALIDEKIDSLLISSSSKDMVNDEIENFNDEVKILYTVELKIENDATAVKVDVNNEPFNIYISGIDIYGKISSVSRSDVNMIVTVNPKTHKVLLTSIPRDYYVQLHGTKGYKDKLTHAGIYGVNMSIQTIEDLLDIDINYYIRVNFTTLINLVDAIGGIDIYSDASFTAWTNHECKFKVGTMHLDGDCALAFARERHAYLTGDRHRVQNQQDVLTAIIKKALSSKTLITKYSKILDSMGSSFQTSIPTSNIYSLINKQLDSMPSWTIENYSLNGTDHKDYTYSSGGSTLLYVMEPDMKTVEEAKEKIDSIEAGN